MVHHITSLHEFDSTCASNSDKLIVVDFTASWCGPCRMIGPYFEQLSNNNPEVCFIKVDVDAGEAIAAAFQVTAMPTFVFIKNGNVVGRFSGGNKQLLNQNLAKFK